MVVGSLPVIRQCASVRLLHRSDSWDKNIRRGTEITCKHPSQVNQWKYSFCKDAGIPCMADGAYVELDREGDAWLKLPSSALSAIVCRRLSSLFLSARRPSIRPSARRVCPGTSIHPLLLFQARRVGDCRMERDGMGLPLTMRSSGAEVAVKLRGRFLSLEESFK